ncbi:MAG: hypothetical protein GXX93_05015, partial [Anaerolineae bacterium]|nr:hypothetical protein [Anaerolineae bacterium]
QYKGEGANGRIVHFQAGPDFDAVVGDASHAYGDRLTRFRRYVAYLKPDVFLVLDDLEAPDPATFDWLAHSYGEITIAGRDVHIRKPKAGLLMRALWPTDASWHLERTPPDSNGERLFKHLALRPAEKARSVPFLVALFVSPLDGAGVPVEVEENGERMLVSVQRGEETVALEFDLAQRTVER